MYIGVLNFSVGIGAFVIGLSQISSIPSPCKRWPYLIHMLTISSKILICFITPPQTSLL